LSRVRLSIACHRYDRTDALHDGRVGVRGAEVTMLAVPPAETFHRMVKYREFDVAEMSLSSYLVSLEHPDPPFVALPVFLSRHFRHSSVYVAQGSRLTDLGELAGRRVGVPEFQQTAGVWVRGVLADDYAVPLGRVAYVQGGQETAGREEKLPLSLPPEVSIEPAPAGTTLLEMLASGDIDALMTPRTPSEASVSGAGLRRLLPDHRAVEEEYFRRTRIFPIMHVVVLRRELHLKHPWLAAELYRAFAQAKDAASVELAFGGANRIMLPWLRDDLARARDLMGDDYWSYGVDRNLHVLSTFLRYMCEQGLTSRVPEPADVFAAGADSEVII
jgi:4,5-dihydroxyphthalate decarboxylase